MSAVAAWLDDTPGETRAVIADARGFRHILFDVEGEAAAGKLGARSIGRVTRIEPGLRGAFVELPEGAEGFLPLTGGARAAAGEKLEVEVVAEGRAAKGPTLRRIGAGEGAVRLTAPGPTAAQWLARLAPGVEPVRGRAAIEAGWQALETAWAEPTPLRGLTVTVERTRALVAVDLDLAPQPGRGLDPRARARANREGLLAAARLIDLRRWGGLVAVDLIGAGHDGGMIAAAARAAFGDDPEIAYGPVNRFGVLQLSLPWRFRPLEEAVAIGAPQRAANEATRRLNFELLADTTRAGVTVRCAPATAALAAPLVARLGPRAHLKADAALGPAEHVIEGV